MADVYRVIGFSLNGTMIPFKEVSIDPQVEAVAEGSGSSVHPQYVAAMKAGGLISMQTYALDALLTAFGSAFAVVLSTTGAKIWLGLVNPAGGIAAGSVHKTITITKGLAVFKMVQGDRGAPAVASLEVHGIRDGANAPFLVAESVAAPTVTPLATMYTLGPLTLDAVDYEPTSLQFQTGVQVKQETLAGSVYPVYANVERTAPEFTIGVLDTDVVATHPLPEGVVDTDIFFTKMVVGGTRVASATEEHIKLSLPKAMVSLQPVQGAWAAEATCGVMVRGMEDSEDGIYSVDLTAALP